MRFSVLMPVYNVEKYISECIDSILNQSFDDWELIIVDDGSPDTSGQIADEYASKDSRIKVIHKANGGLISARREGIKHAQGEYCLFCDSDDMVAKSWMSAIDRTISEFNNPDMIIFSMAKYFSETQEIRPHTFPWTEKKIISPEEAKRELISSSTINELWRKAIKRELLVNDPLDYSINYSNGYAEDILQSLYPFDASKKIAVLPEELYLYRINDSSMMFSKMKIEKALDYTYKDVQKVIYRYITKWENDIPGITNVFFRQCYRKMHSVYTKMILSADTWSEIKSINRFDWSACLPLEHISRYNAKKHLSKKDRIFSALALRPTMIGAYLLRFVFKILNKTR